MTSETTKTPERVDVLILGSGQGGKQLAWHLARQGKRTAVVERRWIGGSCPHVACLPSKNEIWSAKVIDHVRHAAEFGARTGPVEVDMAAVRKRKNDMIESEIALHLRNYKESGAEVIMGTGRFVGPRTLEASLNDGGTRVLQGEQVFLNLGSHAAIPPVPGLEAARPLTHIEALELDYLPTHLVVLGGGYVGLEMAQAYRRFGSRVTVIETGPRLLGREDAEVGAEMQKLLEDEGVTFLVAAEPRQVRGRSGQSVAITVRTAAGEQEIEGSDLLVAAGRVPNTADIGLDRTGVDLDARGFIRVNEWLETSAKGIWAIGECAGSPQFTHVSVDDFRIVRDNLAGGSRSTKGRLVPYCMFTEPPLAHVGLSEDEARRQGVPVRVAQLPMAAVVRTQATGEKRGFMKALVGADDRILGFTMIGADANEVLAVAQTAILARLPYQTLRDAVLAHPTMSEGLGPLLARLPAR